MSNCVHVCKCTCAIKGQKRVSGLPKLELWLVAAIQVQGFEPVSSAGAASAFF